MSVILINLVFLDPANNGGQNRIAKEMSLLLCDMAQTNPTLHLVFVVGDTFVNDFRAWLGQPATIIPVPVDHPVRPALRGLNCDLIVSPLFGLEPIHQIAELRDQKHVVMMPDALALDMPHLFTPQIARQRQASYELLKKAHHIITHSQFSKERLVYHLNLPQERITSIPHGGDSLLPITKTAATIAAYRPFLFLPANTWQHKRHDLALAAFALIQKKRPDLHLVLTGGRSPEFGVNISKLMARYRLLPNRVHDLGYVDDETLSQLYAHAEALLFTSEHEGFGLPLLEAMCFDCPVVCAPVTAIPEVAGDAALYVNSDEPAVWANAVLVDLPKQRASLIERGQVRAQQFTWAKTRARYQEILLHTAPEVFDATNTSLPMVTLIQALHEARVTAPTQPPIAALTKSAVVVEELLSPSSLEKQLVDMNTYLARERASIWGKLPLIGNLFRAIIRLHLMGKFWQTSTLLANQLTQRQLALAAALDELRTPPGDHTE